MSLDPAARDRIGARIAESPVLLFMKGDRQQPQCGFSARVVSILGRLLPDFDTCDVLADPEIREGIKAYSSWPTIPQLYVSGEFVGGCDIIEELYESAELHALLGIEPPPRVEPRVTVEPEAAELIRDAQRRQDSEGQALHIGIDPQFQYTFGFGPARGSEIEVSAGGLTLLFDRDSAGRADGITLLAVQSERGLALSVNNPNAPSVGELGPAELLEWLDRGGLRLIDVREPQERELARIERAEELSEALVRELEALPRDALLVFHCHHGGRSRAAAEHFAGLGFTNVHNLTGGIDAWSQTVDPDVPRY